jgi:hypothetical protein
MSPFFHTTGNLVILVVFNGLRWITSTEYRAKGVIATDRKTTSRGEREKE